MSDTIITVTNLSKHYRVGNERVIALNNINFTVNKGEIVCIVGTSGSGKSTLLNQMAGLEKPTKGSVHIGKRNISRSSEDSLARFRQRHIGFVFQSYNLMPFMTALENVSLPLVFRGVNKGRRTYAAQKVLHEVGLKERLNHLPSQMSGGQQQRVGIARAFVANPDIVFADEPTGNLDSRTTIDVMRMMIRLCRANQQTLIVVTHDRDQARYADRIITLMDGQIVSDVPNQSLYDIESAEEAYQRIEDKIQAESDSQEKQYQELQSRFVVSKQKSTEPSAPHQPEGVEE